jgi:hypothetical protein
MGAYFKLNLILYMAMTLCQCYFVSGKHRPSLTWKPYRDIVTNGVLDHEPHVPLTTILGPNNAIISKRLGMVALRSSSTQFNEEACPVSDLFSFAVPQYIRSEMLKKVNFRKHPRNQRKLTYTLSTEGQRGAIGRAGDSQEEVCQIIWEEFHGTWKNCVSLRKE